MVKQLFPSNTIIFSITLIICVPFFLTPTPDVDIWWHLQIGRDIISHHLWPSPDIYSFITDETWIIHSWLADCLIYLITAGASTVGIANINHTLFSVKLLLNLLFSILVFKELYTSTKNKNASILGALLGAFLIYGMTIRPHHLSFILFLLFRTFFATKSIRRKDILIYVAASIIWVNVHGGFAVVLLIILCIYFLKLIFLLCQIDDGYHKQWTIASGLIMLGFFINPHPIDLLKRVYYASSYPSLDWNGLYWWSVNRPLVAIGITILYFILLFLYMYMYFIQRKFKSYILIVDLTAFLLPWFSFRFSWLLIFPVITVIQFYFTQKKQIISINQLLFIYFVLYLLRFPSTDSLEAYMPKKPVDYLVEQNIRGNIISSWIWSGYITWRTNSEIQIFTDTRIEPFAYDDIQLSQQFEINPLQFIKDISDKGAEYFLLNINDVKSDLPIMESRDFVIVLYKDDLYILGKINKDKIDEYF